MSTFYNKMKFLSYLTWIIVAIMVTVLIYSEVNFFVTLVIAIGLGLALNMLVMIVMVRLENNKAYITSDVKKTIRRMNRVKPIDSFVFVNSIDMLCPNAKDTKIVKVIATVVEKGKEKRKETYYIDSGDDSMNQMVKDICDYKNAKVYSVSEFEKELEELRKGKNIVYFNVVALAKVIHEFGYKSVYDNFVLVNEVCAASIKYKNYIPYTESIYQTNGLVADKTTVMIDFYLNVINQHDIVVKDLLSLGVK